MTFATVEYSTGCTPKDMFLPIHFRSFKILGFEVSIKSYKIDINKIGMLLHINESSNSLPYQNEHSCNFIRKAPTTNVRLSLYGRSLLLQVMEITTLQSLDQPI